jgi:hypothetical protein
MPKKSNINDENQIAASILGQITGVKPEKNPAAVALGKLGGLKGGPARAQKLSAKRLKEIAQIAAKARWKNK